MLHDHIGYVNSMVYNYLSYCMSVKGYTITLGYNYVCGIVFSYVSRLVLYSSISYVGDMVCNYISYIGEITFQLLAD